LIIVLTSINFPASLNFLQCFTTRNTTNTVIIMISCRARHAVALTAFVAFSICSNKGALASQLRAQRQQHQQQHQHNYHKKQPDHRIVDTQHRRELGSVIIVETNNENTNDFDSGYPNYNSQPTPIDYNELLPQLRSGPHDTDQEIDVKYKPDPSAREELFVSDRVVGGFSVEPRSWYSMLLYQDATGWKFAGCGATLITNCHVITAAHCVENRNFDIEGIYVNAHTPYDGNSNHPFRFNSASRIYVPEEYDDYTNVNDIAVIRMSECVNITEYPPAVPASPQNSNLNSGEMLELYGFGRLGENLGESGDTKQLQMAQLPYIPTEECKTYFGDKIRDGMFCAGYAEGGVDACQGDSGSGLLQKPEYPSTEPYILTGIVSWGVGCSRPGYPGVYAKVSDFFDWIKTNTCNDPELDPSISWCTETSLESALMLRQSECSQGSPCGPCEGECQDDDNCDGDMKCFKRGDTPYELIPGCIGTGVASKFDVVTCFLFQ
jgi:Trypsin